MQRIACFISPHGFGHATRTIAVLQALQTLHPDLHPHIFTSVPETLFKQNLTGFTYHHVITDIGLVQTSALETNIPATIAKLDTFLPYPDALLDELSAQCADCSAVLCDIAPLGISVAERTGIPSILVENFTWDWIYSSYITRYPELKKHALTFKKLFEQADYRIQTAPLCQTVKRDLFCGPVFRTLRNSRTHIRKKIGCISDKKMILITMGGVTQKLPPWNTLDQLTDYYLVFTGQTATHRPNDRILLLDRFSDLYHPDLIAAAELVVCKAGYSTLAECCQAGARVLSVGRDTFPETAPLQNYLQTVLGATSIDTEKFLGGQWLSMIPQLLLQPHPSPMMENGAHTIASFLSDLI